MAGTKTKKTTVKSGGTATARKLVTVLIALATFMGLAYFYLANLPLYLKFVGGIVLLLVSGFVIATTNGLPYVAGMYMMGGKRGIDTIERLSKTNGKLWEAVADWSLVVGFGLLAYPLFKKQISRRMFAFGLVSFLLIALFLVPFLSLSIGLFNIPQLNSMGATSTVTSSLNPIGFITNPAIEIENVIGLMGGFVLYFLALLVFNAGRILFAIGAFAVGIITSTPNTVALSQQIPGVAPVIPGITIPLFAGLAALAVLLIAHEFSHGVLARIYKIKIKSVGLLLLGVIPFGAYVEPDEKALVKLPVQKQTRIFAAGSAANMLLTVIFFVILIAFLIFIIPHFVHTQVVVAGTVPGSPSVNVLVTGSVIESWNGHQIKNASDVLAAGAADMPNMPVHLVTNKGNYTIVANQTGKIGVYLGQATLPSSGGLLGTVVYFFYNFVLLSLVFNFSLAVFNMFPMVILDGWRIFNVNVKNKNAVKALQLFIIVAVLVNVLPLLWGVSWLK